MLSARAGVRSLYPYRPPLADRAGLRMDFNENTAGCSPRVLARLRELSAAELARYPEREPVEGEVAAFLALPREQLLLTNGVDEAIHLVCQTYVASGDEAIIPQPTFAMYGIAAHLAGARLVEIAPEPDFRFAAQRILAAITPRTRLIAVASPNNPTGAVAGSDDLVRIARAAPDAALLVDEAYFEFHGHTMLGESARLPNLLVARTFSKAYGLAGLRAGVLAGAGEQIAMLRRVSSPYNVNAAALACLPVALADQDYVRAYVADVRTGREQLRTQLAEAGVESWPSAANFVLGRFGECREQFVSAMRRLGVLVRDRHSDRGCADCVRISVGAETDNQLLFAALKQALPECGLSAARQVTA